MRRFVSVASALGLSLGLVAQAVPVDAVAGYDSAYSGESAFLTLTPNQVGTFTVFFANTGTTTWVKGTGTQVDLAVCLEDKVTCNVSDPLDAAFVAGWQSASRYTTATQSTVAPGQIGTFTYSVLPPANSSGLHRFNGAVVVSATGENIHNEGYYQDVLVVQPSVTGIVVTPTDKMTNTLSTPIGTANGARGIRTYTVTLGSDVTAPLRIGLFPVENVISSTSFADLDGNQKADLNCGTGNCTRWLLGAVGTAGASSSAVQASIDTINGVATGGGQGFEASPPSGSNQIVFTVNSTEMDQIVPIAWKDANGDSQLDLTTPPCCGADTSNVLARQATGAGTPTEKLGIGGQINWAPENAGFATYSCNILNSDGDGRVVFVDPDSKYVVARHNGLLRRFNWSSTTAAFYVNTATANTDGPGLATGQLEAYLSPRVQNSASVASNAAGEDRIQVAYNPDPAAQSKITFCADRPAAPASITTSITDAPDTVPVTQNECATTPCTAGTDTDTDSDDVSVSFPLSANPCVQSYTVERQTTTDNGITYTTAEAVTVNGRIKNSGDTTVTVYDLNVPVGVHRWRVRSNANDPNTTSDIAGGGGTNDPECGINAADSLNRTSSNQTITTQPGGGGPVSGRPVSVDARISANAGLSQTLDTGDVFKVAFNESMSSNTTTGATIWVRDSDATVGTITCTVAAAATPTTAAQAWNYSASCDWNTSDETLGGIVYPTRTVLTVVITSTAGPTTFTGAGAPTGTQPGVQIPATIFDSSSITDTTGDSWDIAKSSDVIIDNE
jgi:hypothetical protein